MSAPTTVPHLPATAAVLACRLRPAGRRRGGVSPSSGEVELENLSSTPVEIEVRAAPLQHLNLIVTDAAGRVVSDGFYGAFFSPTAEPFLFRLQPGEKYTHPVSLLATVPGGRDAPGRYAVQAVFEWRSIRAVSEPLVVEIPEPA